MTPRQAIADRLIENYCLSKRLAHRYAKILVWRAIDDFLNNGLDSVMVEEDLYQDEDGYVNLADSELELQMEGRW